MLQCSTQLCNDRMVNNELCATFKGTMGSAQTSGRNAGRPTRLMWLKFGFLGWQAPMTSPT